MGREQLIVIMMKTTNFDCLFNTDTYNNNAQVQYNIVYIKINL